MKKITLLICDSSTQFREEVENLYLNFKSSRPPHETGFFFAPENCPSSHSEAAILKDCQSILDLFLQFKTNVYCFARSELILLFFRVMVKEKKLKPEEFLIKFFTVDSSNNPQILDLSIDLDGRGNNLEKLFPSYNDLLERIF